MAALYLDTSALVKRYAAETGTSWTVSLISTQFPRDIYTVRVTGPEMIAAIIRKLHRREVSEAEAISAVAAFKSDWRTQYQIVEVTPAIADRAMALAERYGLRAYDAMHLAAALTLQAVRCTMGLPTLTFVSADDEQLAVAEAELLRVENPNRHL